MAVSGMAYPVVGEAGHGGGELHAGRSSSVSVRGRDGVHTCVCGSELCAAVVWLATIGCAPSTAAGKRKASGQHKTRGQTEP